MHRLIWLGLICLITLNNQLFASGLEKRAQVYLNLSGIDVGAADGLVGPKTRRGMLRAFEALESKAPDKIDSSTIDALKQNYFQNMAALWSGSPHLSKTVTVADARHLLERSGIGASAYDIANIVGRTRADAVLEVLSGYSQNLSVALPSFIFEQPAEYWIRWDYDEFDRQAFRVERDREIAELKLWWVRQMIQTDQSQNERLILFWTNHFPTAYSAIDEESLAIAKQHLMFRTFGFGNFREMVKQLIRDPAMLNYLDGNDSRKGAPNENLARELMELFVLGEGNYDEFAVKEAARALTGNTVNRLKGLQFRFAPWRHDPNNKTLFGNRGRFDGDDLVDILFQQDAASLFLTKKMWRTYVSEYVLDDVEIARIANAFRASDYEIPVLIAELFSSPIFWDESTRGTIVKSPVDLVIGTIRASGFLPIDWQRIPNIMANLGQNIFEPPNVAGWPGGDAWVSPANLLNRTQFLISFFNTQGDGISTLAIEDPEASLKRNDTIIVRYGAEDFRGPPVFRVKLHAQRTGTNSYKAVWQSPSALALGGHDSELFGRLQESDIPWRLAQFEIDPSLEYDKVTVEFTNDNCCGPGGSDGGDRNFFVDWVKVGKQLYLAQDGRQISNCQNNNQNPGHLYCQGSLIMTDGVSMAHDIGSPLDIKEDQLVVERVAFEGGDEYDPLNDWNNLTIGLLNVRHNEYEQPALEIELVARRRGEILMEISEVNCATDCLLGGWPKSSDIWDDGSRAIKISLGPREEWLHKQQYLNLTEKDRQMVSALWMSVPDFVEQMQGGRSFKNRNGEEILSSWAPVFERLNNRLPKSRFASKTPLNPLLVGKDPSKRVEGMMAMAMSAVKAAAPWPTGKSPIETTAAWQSVTERMLGGYDIADYILALSPVVQINSAPPEMLITDPVFHLK